MIRVTKTIRFASLVGDDLLVFLCLQQGELLANRWQCAPCALTALYNITNCTLNEPIKNGLKFHLIKNFQNNLHLFFLITFN